MREDRKIYFEKSPACAPVPKGERSHSIVPEVLRILHVLSAESLPDGRHNNIVAVVPGAQCSETSSRNTKNDNSHKRPA